MSRFTKDLCHTFGSGLNVNQFYWYSKSLYMEKNTQPDSHLDELFTNPEPWEPWENKLVIWSIIIAIVGLGILGVLINWLIL